MYDSMTVSVGLDVHASSVRLAAVRGDELLEERTIAYDLEVVARCLRRWPGVRCCYEAGPTGFDLYRYLVERGIDCEVVAPALVPERPGDRVKTDSRDARKLARLYAGGLLEPIWVPSPELEAARDLIRAREDARLERMAARHRLSKLLFRNGRRLPGKSWGVTRRRWLGEQRFAFNALQLAYDHYLHALDLVDARIAALEQEIATLAEQGPWAELVAKLRCLRGVETLTALGIATEIGDFARFTSAEEFMSFVGLVPSERSSGARRRQGAITKVGNAHVQAAAGRGRLARSSPADGRPRASSPAARPGRARARTLLALPAASLPTLVADGCARHAAAEDRRCLRARARRFRLGDRDRAATPEFLTTQDPSLSSSGCAQPHGEPSSALCGTRPG
jgi:transposase